MLQKDYLKYYWLEDYLFNDVRRNFLKRESLNAAEFFCIVIWKANRAKTAIKRKLEKKGDLNEMVKKLTYEIFLAPDDSERLRIMLEKWGFALPMASAVLTVLYPKRFSVYDVRVREELNIKDFARRKNQIKRYFAEFLPKVRKSAPGKSLRDKDRYIWAKSFYEGLLYFLKE